MRDYDVRIYFSSARNDRLGARGKKYVSALERARKKVRKRGRERESDSRNGGIRFFYVADAIIYPFIRLDIVIRPRKSPRASLGTKNVLFPSVEYPRKIPRF